MLLFHIIFWIFDVDLPRLLKFSYLSFFSVTFNCINLTSPDDPLLIYLPWIENVLVSITNCRLVMSVQHGNWFMLGGCVTMLNSQDRKFMCCLQGLHQFSQKLFCLLLGQRSTQISFPYTRLLDYHVMTQSLFLLVFYKSLITCLVNLLSHSASFIQDFKYIIFITHSEQNCHKALSMSFDKHVFMVVSVIHFNGCLLLLVSFENWFMFVLGVTTLDLQYECSCVAWLQLFGP